MLLYQFNAVLNDLYDMLLMGTLSVIVVANRLVSSKSISGWIQHMPKREPKKTKSKMSDCITSQRAGRKNLRLKK